MIKITEYKMSHKIFVIDRWFDIVISDIKSIGAGRIHRPSMVIEVTEEFFDKPELEQKYILYVLYFSILNWFGEKTAKQDIYFADESALEQLVLEGYNSIDIIKSMTNTLKNLPPKTIELSEKRIKKLKSK